MPRDREVAGCGCASGRGRGVGESSGCGSCGTGDVDVRAGREGWTDKCPYCDGHEFGGAQDVSGDPEDSEEAPPSATDLAWAAGLFDGEGNVWIGQEGTVQLKIDMMSSRPVWKIQKVLGGGVTTWNHKNGHTVWRWRETGKEGVLRVVRLLTPFCQEKGFELLQAAGVIVGTFRADDARALVKRSREMKKNGKEEEEG